MFDKHWERFLLGVKTCGHVKCIKFWSQIGTKTSSPSAWDHWTQFMFYFAGSPDIPSCWQLAMVLGPVRHQYFLNRVMKVMNCDSNRLFSKQIADLPI